MILIWIIMALTGGTATVLLLLFQRKIMLKNWRLLALVNIWFIIFWCIGESVARQNNLWHISFDNFSGTEILGTQLGNIIYFAVVTTILATVALIMEKTYSEGKRFHDIFFKEQK
jgi:hypothetical protein